MAEQKGDKIQPEEILENEIEVQDTSKMYDIDHEFYDFFYSDLKHDFEFYKDMASKAGGPILECMCGTGRVTLELARAGFKIDGFDLNDSMLEKAREKLAKEPEQVSSRANLWKDDIRSFKSERKYGLIFIPFNSFLHLLTREDRLAALKSIKSHLQPEGLFIVEFFNPDLTRPERIFRCRDDLIKHNEETGETIMRYESQTFNRKEKTSTVHYFYDTISPDGTVKRKINKWQLAYIFYDDMEDLAADAGYEIAEVYGDHEKTPFTEASPLMIWVLKEKKKQDGKEKEKESQPNK